MLEALTSCAVPLRPSGLYALISHKEECRMKEEAKRAYMINVQYSILGSLHAMCKHDLQMPSYSEFVRMLDDPKKPVSKQTPQETLQSAVDMLHLFAKENTHETV